MATPGKITINGKPSEPGKKDGEIKRTTGTQLNNFGPISLAFTYWKWDAGKKDWIETNKQEWEENQPGGTTAYSVLGTGTTTGSLRYPKDAAMQSGSDYVLFEFYEYQPPFQNINKGAARAGGSALSVYNQSATDAKLYEKTSLQSVILYMPEDVSTGYKANWSGKAFSNLGRDALATAGSGDFGEAMQNAMTGIGDAFNQAIPNAGAKVIQEVIGKITGESLEPNDIFAATRGVILNPNVELLFSGIDLRNFQLNYKLVPRSAPEAETIKQIVNVFRKAMLPKFAKGDELIFSGENNTANNYIKVPNVCKVTFMQGSSPNKNVAQYKMCAITQVDVNYTPDGTYATYDDGNMVAIGLSLAFQETKLVFAEEVENY